MLPCKQYLSAGVLSSDTPTLGASATGGKRVASRGKAATSGYEAARSGMHYAAHSRSSNQVRTCHHGDRGQRQRGISWLLGT